MAKDQELVKATIPGALDRPDFVAVGDQSGTEHLTREDIQMPRMGLGQQMSPEMVEGDAKYIDGLKVGAMFNNLTGQVYGTGPLDFVVISAYPPRWVEFIPREEGGGVRDPNVPPGDPRTAFGPNGELPKATKFYDFVVMLLPTRELIALSFKNTGLKVARQLNGLIAMRNASIYSGKYTLSSVMVQNSKGRFAVFLVKNAGWVQDKETYLYAQRMFTNLATKTVIIEREHPDEDPTSFDAEALERESQAAAAAASAATANRGDTEGM